MSWLHIVEALVGLTVGGAAIYTVVLYARSVATKVNIQISKDTIENQGETIDAQTARLDLMHRDLAHERDLNVQREHLIKSQNARIEHLETIITARDLIENQTAMLRRAFVHLNVPVEILDRSS